MLFLVALMLAAPASGTPLFEDDGVLEIKLSGPLSTLIKNKKVRDEYTFALTINGETIDLDVRVRGNSRLVLCRFPPLRLNFPDDVDLPAAFAGQEKLKLVTHCKGDSDRAENNVLEEYLAYRLFNLLSDKSYRVRLLSVTYDDSDGKVKDLDRPYYGYLIESDVELAQRIGGELAEITGVRYGLLDPRQTALMYVFQYLIGNTDWSLVKAETEDTCCHNVDLIDVDGQLIPIPYDFDFSGLVNAAYAVVNENLPIKRVTQRHYRGYCLSKIEDVTQAYRDVVALEEQILGIPAEVPAMDEKFIKDRVRFLGHFFEEARNDEKRLFRTFERRCVGPS